MESLGLSQKDVQFMNKWRRIKEATGSPGKMAIKTQCVCVCITLIQRSGCYIPIKGLLLTTEVM